MERQSVAMYLATEMKHAREGRGWSLYRLAKETGISAGHLSKIERGLNSPRADVLHTICSALDYKVLFPLHPL